MPVWNLENLPHPHFDKILTQPPEKGHLPSLPLHTSWNIVCKFYPNVTSKRTPPSLEELNELAFWTLSYPQKAKTKLELQMSKKYEFYE